PTQQSSAQSGFMGAAVRRRDRIAIGMDEAIVFAKPGDRPFERAMPAAFLDLAGKALLRDEILTFNVLRKIILEAAGEVEDGFRREIGRSIEQGRAAMPADLDAAEEIGLCPRHAKQTCRLEFCALTENVGIGFEAHARATPVRCLAYGF